MACKNKEKLKQSSNNFFGQNFKEFESKPEDAINHLLEVKSGQVINAMEKKGVGSIDFIYGNSQYGLAHIIERRDSDGYDGVAFAKSLPALIKDADITIKNERRAILETKGEKIILGLVWDDMAKTWLISGYKKDKKKRAAKSESPTPDKLNEDMDASSSTTPIKDIISNVEKEIKDNIQQFKTTKSKRDFIIDRVWDVVMSGFDITASPFKFMLHMLNNKIDPNKDWFKVSQVQKMSNDLINDYRNLKAGIYEGASDIKAFLDELSPDDSKSLVHALGGDIDAAELNPKIVPLYERFRDVIDQNASELVDLGVLAEENKIKEYLKRYYSQYIEDGHFGSSLAYEKLKKRKDLTLEERQAIGMVEDAAFVIPHTIAEQKIQIQKARLLKQIADDLGSDEKIDDNYVQIPDIDSGGGVKRYGALSGKWVHKDVKMDIDNARVIKQQMKVLEDGLYPIIDHLKVNLTVKNPVTHVYNIGSNILLAFLNGDYAALGQIIYMRAKKPDEFKALLSQANKHGLNSYLDDFEQAHVDLEPDKKSTNVVMSILKNLYLTQDTKAGDATRKLYDWEDKIFKLAAFKKNLEAGMDEKTAYKTAVDVYVDYSTPLPSAIRFLDKSGLMPFLHYQYKATPATAKVMLKHPFRTLLLGTGIATLGASSFQNDDEEYKTPEWANDKFNLFGVSEWFNLGNGWYINAGRMIPGTKFEFELGGIVKGVLGIVNGKTPLGYNIDSTYDDKSTAYAKRALVMAENYMPTVTFGRYGQRTVNIALGNAELTDPKKNYYNEDMTYEELALRALGVRKFNEDKELKSKLRKAKNLKKHRIKKGDDKKELEKQYTNTARKIKKVSKKDLSASSKDGFAFPKLDLDKF